MVGVVTMASRQDLDRDAVLARFARIRARSRSIFAMLDDSLYYERPIPLRNPVVFYEGHLPAFAVNTLIKRALGEPGIDERFEAIFARGIDPEDERSAVARGNPAWPDREVVRRYAAEADRRIAAAIAGADLERDGHPLLHRAEALWTILEHEEMHQETLAYMWHQVDYARKRAPDGYVTALPADVRRRPGERAAIPAGPATLGTPADAPFAWDNERPCHRVSVGRFTVDVHNVTNGDYMDFVDAGGYTDARWWTPGELAWLRAGEVRHPPFWLRGEDGQWRWRGMFESVPLPADWPVWVTWAEAQAYARWRGRRLMSEAEFHRAAFGTGGGAERHYPWGDAPAVYGNYDFRRWDPEPAGMHPEAASAFGVHDLVGNGWEWTATPFRPFPGFRPMASYPEYSADFFDDGHYVLKGASPVTGAALVRPGFRNWFRPRYPYVYAAFRCVDRDA